MTGIFEPFGTLDIVTLIKNETGKSKGYGFVTVCFPLNLFHYLTVFYYM